METIFKFPILLTLPVIWISFVGYLIVGKNTSIFTWILQLEPEIITLALFRNLFKYSCWLSLIFSRIIDNLHFIIHVNAIMPEKIQLACKDFNPFQIDVPYLFPLKTSENLWFQEVQKLIIGLKWVEYMHQSTICKKSCTSCSRCKWISGTQICWLPNIGIQSRKLLMKLRGQVFQFYILSQSYWNRLAIIRSKFRTKWNIYGGVFLRKWCNYFPKTLHHRCLTRF